MVRIHTSVICSIHSKKHCSGYLYFSLCLELFFMGVFSIGIDQLLSATLCLQWLSSQGALFVCECK